MKTLIVYRSKYGAARKCCEALKEKLQGDIEVYDLKNKNNFVLGDYDRVIVGGSIYAGQIQKEVKEFCTKNLEELKNKNLGLFICCMSDDKKAEEQIKASFPELIEFAKVKDNFGGEFKLSSMNFFERFIIKKMAKISEDKEDFKFSNLQSFADKMNSI